ncbi:MAG: efflux RND transporter permease subunit [Hyphomicrobiales bacterium]
MKLTKVSIQRSTIVVVIFAILAFLGINSYSKLGYELLPKIAPPVMTMVTIYPGASPKEVENSVTKKIEEATSSLENIKKVSSSSKENISIVAIEFNYGVDIDLLIQNARQKLSSIRNELPDEAKETSISKWSVDDLPIMNLGVSADLSNTELYDLIDQRVKPALSQVKGVAKIAVIGGAEREIQVNVNKEKLEGYGLSILQVYQAIKKANQDMPAGKIKSEEGQKLIRVSGQLKSINQLKDIVIAIKDNSTIRLHNVADVNDASEDEDVLVRTNRSNAIGLNVLKQSDANAVEVSRQVKEKLSKLEEVYNNDNLKFQVALDSTDFTIEAADAVMHDLIIAIVLVALVMVLFLQSFRNSIIVMISVPASLIATFIVMYFAGFTLNMMTLLGLSLVVGILVDDAIVVIENIHRHMEMGKNRMQASYDAIKEIGLTVASITLVIVIVFIPLATIDGMTGDIFRQFSIVVATSTLVSLFVAFTLIPMLSSRFAKIEHFRQNSFIGKMVNRFESFIERCTNGIIGLLKWSFNHKLITLGLTVLLFIGSVMLIGKGFIGAEFASNGDRGEFVLNIELPRGATVQQNNAAVLQAEDLLYQQSEVKNVFATIGTTSTAAEGEKTAYKSELRVKLKDSKDRKKTDGQIAKEFQIKMEELIPGIKVETSIIQLTGNASAAPIQIDLLGPDVNELMAFGEKVKEVMAKVSGTGQIKSSIEAGSPELQVVVDRDKMASLGLDISSIGYALRTAFNGNDEIKYRDGSNEYNVNIRFDQFNRQSKEDILNTSFINNKGKKIKLSQFADVDETISPSQLDRKNRISCVTISSGVFGRPSGTVGDEIQEEIAQLDKPSDITISAAGDIEFQKDAFSSLAFAFIASILFTYLIMVALYDSYIYPLVVLFSIPLAIIGALLALALARQTLNIFSLLGIIMLIGLVAKNAILLVDFAIELKNKGVEIKEALIQASKTRFRPIIMTTLAMVFGMLPIALAAGAGAEWKNGLAWSLIGGLLSSLVLTMVVVPLVFYLFERLRIKLGIKEKKNPVVE